MDSLTESSDSGVDPSLGVDRTVTYFLFGIGILLAFGLLLSTFLQVNHVTTKPSRGGTAAVQPSEPEIGARPPASTR